jgi:hypothetical protein
MRQGRVTFVGSCMTLTMQTYEFSGEVPRVYDVVAAGTDLVVFGYAKSTEDDIRKAGRLALSRAGREYVGTGEVQLAVTGPDKRIYFWRPRTRHVTVCTPTFEDMHDLDVLPYINITELVASTAGVWVGGSASSTQGVIAFSDGTQPFTLVPTQITSWVENMGAWDADLLVCAGPFVHHVTVQGGNVLKRFAARVRASAGHGTTLVTITDKGVMVSKNAGRTWKCQHPFEAKFGSGEHVDVAFSRGRWLAKVPEGAGPSRFITSKDALSWQFVRTDTYVAAIERIRVTPEGFGVVAMVESYARPNVFGFAVR